MHAAAAAAAKLLQSCPTLCDPIDGSPPGSPIPGILQARNWSGLPFPSPGSLATPGTELSSPALQVDSLLTEVLEKPHDTWINHLNYY